MKKSLIDADGEVQELSDDFFERAKRGRPHFPMDLKSAA